MTTTDVADDSGSGSAAVDGNFRPSLVPLIAVVGRKQVILLARYPVNTATLFISQFVFFALIFFGGRAVAGPSMTDSADGIVVGFFLWTLATRAFRSIAADVTSEAQWGTLQRLFVSPYGFGTVLCVATLVNVLVTLVWGGVMLLAMMVVTGRWLHVDLLTVVPLATATLAPIVGVGFVVGGLALVYKRVESLFGLLTFGFVGLIAAPVGKYEWLKLLPVTQGSYLTRTAMEAGIRLWEFTAPDLTILIITAVVYLLGGYYCFHRAQIKARREGLLNQY